MDYEFHSIVEKLAILEYKVNSLSRLVEQMINILESLTSQITSDKIQQWKRDLHPQDNSPI